MHKCFVQIAGPSSSEVQYTNDTIKLKRPGTKIFKTYCCDGVFNSSNRDNYLDDFYDTHFSSRIKSSISKHNLLLWSFGAQLAESFFDLGLVHRIAYGVLGESKLLDAARVIVSISVSAFSGDVTDQIMDCLALHGKAQHTHPL